jgi:hypothetical protein
VHPSPSVGYDVVCSEALIMLALLPSNRLSGTIDSMATMVPGAEDCA